MNQSLNYNYSKRKIYGLDSLREIAILGAIGCHLAPGIFPGGFLDVNLFLEHSGFSAFSGIFQVFPIINAPSIRL